MLFSMKKFKNFELANDGKERDGEQAYMKLFSNEKNLNFLNWPKWPKILDSPPKCLLQ
jgi:hypothetical protein